MINPELCVVGASNIDLISYIPRLPVEGETIHGTEFRMGFGGKGANQAIMAAKPGAKVGMITKLGDDIFGKQALENFQKYNINTSNVYFTDAAFSGVAPISVDGNGSNSIIIVTGANDLLPPDEIESSRLIIAESKVLICQMEIQIDISLSALRIAKKAGVLTIFNPASASKEIPDEIYSLIDIISPNETEAEILTGININCKKDAESAGSKLLDKRAGRVIITPGKQGCIMMTEEVAIHYPSDKVAAVDSTGAGDAFIGSLAA